MVDFLILLLAGVFATCIYFLEGDNGILHYLLNHIFEVYTLVLKWIQDHGPITILWVALLVIALSVFLKYIFKILIDHTIRWRFRERLISIFVKQIIYLLYILRIPSRWAGWIWRGLTGSWGRAVISLLFLVMMLSISFSAVSLHWIDPLDLKNKSENISIAPVPSPIDDVATLEQIGIFTISLSYVQAFSDKFAFQKLLENDTIFDFVMNSGNTQYLAENISQKKNKYKADFKNAMNESKNWNKAIFEHIIQPWARTDINSTAGNILQGFTNDVFSTRFNKQENLRAVLSDSNIFNYTISRLNATDNSTISPDDIYCDPDLRSKSLNLICNNSTMKALCFLAISTMDNNAYVRDIIIQSIYDNQTLRNELIKWISENKTLMADCYIQISYNNSSIRSQIVGIFHNNVTRRNATLAAVFSDDQMKAISISLASSDRALRENLLNAQSYVRPEYYYLYSAVFVWYYWQSILFLWILLQALLWLSHVGRSLSVVEFSYEPMEYGENKGQIAPGLASLLVGRLNRLNRLYHQMDEARPIASMAGNAIGSAIKVDEGDMASSVFADDSKISLGGFAIPGKLINSLINRLSNRPTIYGSLHVVDEYNGNNNLKKKREILTARMSGGGRTLSWRVEDQTPLLDPIGKRNDEVRTRDDMVTELACRIFNDLTFDREKIVPWKATWHFHEGLRKYRESLHSQENRITLSINAKKSFEEAIKQDHDYPWAHYNLGLVCLDMAHIIIQCGNTHFEFARSEFCRCRDLYPLRWQPYYAEAWVCNELGLNAQNQKRNELLGNARSLCKKALRLRPDCIGLAQIYRLLGQQENDDEKHRYLALSAYYSLCSLCIAEFRGENTDEERHLAWLCLCDLAGKDDSNRDFLKKLARNILLKECIKNIKCN